MTDAEPDYPRAFHAIARLMGDTYLAELQRRDPEDAERLAVLVAAGWRISVALVYGTEDVDPLIEFALVSDETGERRRLATMPLRRIEPDTKH